jgi:hypothetical protein
MSLEAKIEHLSSVIEKLIAALEKQEMCATPAVAAPVAAPVVQAPVAAPVVQAPVADPVMPAPPVFAPVAPVEAPPAATQAAPFNDAKGLVDYVMKSYREMGPQKGANIQKVLVSVGYQNINDVQPHHYFDIWDGIEKLRVS